MFVRTCNCTPPLLSVTWHGTPLLAGHGGRAHAGGAPATLGARAAWAQPGAADGDADVDEYEDEDDCGYVREDIRGRTRSPRASWTRPTRTAPRAAPTCTTRRSRCAARWARGSVKKP